MAEERVKETERWRRRGGWTERFKESRASWVMSR